MEDQKKIAYEYLEHGQNALKAGDIDLAKEYCDLAEKSAPELEEVWLLKATLSEPSESVLYLQKALEINPDSSRAKKGLLWAEKRLNILEAEDTEVNNAEEPVEVLHSEENEAFESLDKNPFKIGTSEEANTSLENVSQTQEIAAAKEVKAKTKVEPFAARTTATRWWITPLSVSALVLLIAFGLAFRPAWSDVIDPIGSNAQNTVIPSPTTQPTEIPTEVSTSVVIANAPLVLTATASLQPTNTLAATATFTATATATAEPSSISESDQAPTATSDAPILMTVTPNPAWIGVPSPTPLPTDTEEPGYSNVPSTPVVSVPIYDTDPSSRWIDVNLSQQMLYAYEGNTLVNAFVVSSGTWQYPTVTGSYNVYVKYLYKDMWGDDYYLPDVPYTMFFYEGYAIHGTYWHNNFGTPMSHGCVNMTIPDAGWVYEWASMGTTVNVHY